MKFELERGTDSQRWLIEVDPWIERAVALCAITLLADGLGPQMIWRLLG